MKQIDPKSVDFCFLDLPYGVTRCKWDSIIPFDKLWEQLLRVTTDNAAICFTAIQPFSSAVVMSNPKMFKHEWTWRKDQMVNFQNCKREPGKITESILVFYKKPPVYNPQGLIKLDTPIRKSNKRKGGGLGHIDSHKKRDYYYQYYANYPVNLQHFKQERGKHPTQKPLALYEYFYNTYSHSGMTVLDCCAGSFTAAVAADNTKRNWICIEKEKEFCELGVQRINENRRQLNLPEVTLNSFVASELNNTTK